MKDIGYFPGNSRYFLSYIPLFFVYSQSYGITKRNSCRATSFRIFLAGEYTAADVGQFSSASLTLVDEFLLSEYSE